MQCIWLYMRNLQEQVKKAFCYQKLFWPFTVWINCSSDLKIFENSRPSASNFKSFSRSLEQFFLTVGQNNFGNKIPLLAKIQQTKMLVTCQRFGDWFLFGLVWPYSSNQKNIMKVGSKSLRLTCSSNKLWAYLYYIFLIRRES